MHERNNPLLQHGGDGDVRVRWANLAPICALDLFVAARLRLENGLETATKHLEEGAGHAREWDSAAITADDLESMRSIVVIQKEGIIYCPIAKVRVQLQETRPMHIDSAHHIASHVGLLCDVLITFDD